MINFSFILFIFSSNHIKKLFCLNLTGFILFSYPLNLKAEQLVQEKFNNIDSSYINPRNELGDYILDTGDVLNIEFETAPELSGNFEVNEEGEIFFNRIKETYVRGLTIKDLKIFLEKRYSEILISPELYIRIIRFRDIKLAIYGEVRKPGIYKFNNNYKKSITSQNNFSFLKKNDLNDNSNMQSSASNIASRNSNNLEIRNINLNDINSNSDYLITVSDAIRKANGLTSFSDISKIEIIREIPPRKGGGKKKTTIDLTDYFEGKLSTNQDIRVFSGDIISIPSLANPNKSIVRKSIISGLSPKFINVNVSGQISNPGTYLIPLEGSLSDALNLSGPRKPLTGKVFLIRYKRDGSLLRKNINYSSNAAPGSLRNPYLISGDYITIQKNNYGRISETISAITQPFLGVYATKELYESLTGN